MSRYWNKILIDKMISSSNKPNIRYKLNTDIGRFYFYFKKEENSKVSGRLIFFPNNNLMNVEKQ